MARKRADDYDDKRQTILDKAAAIIARKGFNSATMMDVARACDASKSHLYHYFSSKEDLLYYIIHDHISQQAAELDRIVKLPLPVEERFDQFVDCFVQGAARSRNEHLILMNDIRFLPKRQRDEVRDMKVHMTTLLESLLVEINPDLMTNQRFRRPYALLLFGMMIWTFSWYRRNGPITARELAKRISTLYLHGFTAESAVLASEN